MVTEVLKLAQLIDEHRMAKVQIGRRGVEARLDTQGFTASQTRSELAFYEDLLGFKFWWDFEVPDELASRVLMVPTPCKLTATYLWRPDLVLNMMHFGEPAAQEAYRVRKLNEPGLSHLALSVEDVPALLAKVEEYGGEIIHDPANTEVGTYELTLSEEGRNDALFSMLPLRFMAQMGHKDRAARTMNGIPNLASSERSPMQALRIVDKPIWATQFHPELDRETNLDRYHHYLEGYAPLMSAEERSEALTRFKDSPETSKLLPRFLELVFPS